jgi:hypothetical protein
MALALALAIYSAPGAANELTAREILQKAHCAKFYQGDDSSGRVVLDITDRQGRQQQRELTMLRRDDGQGCDKQSFYAYFLRPSDVREMRFLVSKDPSKEDDRWLYLPALDLVKRISSADKRTSFAGSHFLYEDVSGRHIDDDTHKLIETTDKYFLIESHPKDKSVDFKYFKIWIHRKTFMPVKGEFYDKGGKKYRTYEIKKVENIDGFPTVVHVRVTDQKMGGHSDMRVTKMKYNLGLPEDIFGERYLRKVPQKYLN